MKKNFLFTSESVSEGHPDKICDQISDAVVDLYLKNSDQKDQVRVACETMVTTNKVIIAGEVRGPDISNAEIENITREVVKEIGYEQDNFHWKNFDFNCFLHAQSVDIAQGVDANNIRTEGAGDQGIMFGFACKDTETLMPAPIHYSHQILYKMAQARKDGSASGLEPDSKSQVTIEYKDDKPFKVKSVVISTQHSKNVNQEQVRELVKPYLKKIIPDEILRLTHNDGREIEFVLKSIVKPEPGHYTCFFNSKGDWYYYNDLKLCTNKNYLGLNDKGLKKIGSYSNLLKNRDSKLGCIYIYYPSDS